MIALIGALSCLAASPGAAQTAAAPLIIAADEEASTYAGKLARLLYAEISKRSGIPIEVQSFPQRRRNAMSEYGQVDGETSRIQAYGETQPNLIRVDESLLDLNFHLYATDPGLRLQRLDDLKGSRLTAEYRRGVIFCERALKSVLPAEQINDVTESAQGLRKLATGRSDIYCELEVSALTPLNSSDIPGIGAVRKVLDLGSIPTFPFLQKQHAELVPRFVAAIRKMKADGAIEAIKLQARREMGWTR